MPGAVKLTRRQAEVLVAIHYGEIRLGQRHAKGIVFGYWAQQVDFRFVDVGSVVSKLYKLGLVRARVQEASSNSAVLSRYLYLKAEGVSQVEKLEEYKQGWVEAWNE